MGRGGGRRGIIKVVKLVTANIIRVHQLLSRVHTHTHTHTNTCTYILTTTHVACVNSTHTHTVLAYLPKDSTGGSFLLTRNTVMLTLLDVVLASLGYTVTVMFLCGLSAMASFVMELEK